MGLSAAADVRFDYVASLQLARRLWALGDEVERAADRTGMTSAAEPRSPTGSVSYGTQFAERIDAE